MQNGGQQQAPHYERVDEHACGEADAEQLQDPVIPGQELLEPFKRTLERLTPPARAHFMEGMRLLNEESGGFGAGRASGGW